MTADPGYDPFHDPMLGDPYPLFARAREEAPVFYAAQIDHWVVARRADILEVFRDLDSFSATNSITPITELGPGAQQILRDGGWGITPALGNNDRPEHLRFRRNVSRAFTARRVAELEPFITERAHEVVDGFAAAGEADLVSALLWELPARVILHLLGIPEESAPIVQEAADNRVRFIWGSLEPLEQERLAEAMVRFWAHLRQLVEERIASPRSDLTSALLEVRGGDDSVFTVDEICSVLFAFLTAGHETTSSLLANAVRRLLEDPTA
ncbi:cytochrome P450 [Marmoricola bigeumensis]|uniref:Cytochrome P450 n=1 Tax=Nocardioides marmoribigeumensis TaxID=433649 RepID=A0ABU2BUX0_9ACTN|nr:cytochrome P450 [Nocardioides marmoribigeumensis]